MAVGFWCLPVSTCVFVFMQNAALSKAETRMTEKGYDDKIKYNDKLFGILGRFWAELNIKMHMEIYNICVKATGLHVFSSTASAFA